MRHGKKFNHLGRTASHRKALLKNMAISLIMEKRIFTTLAKAKELRKFVEPLITRGKTPDMHNHRVVFAYLQDKGSVKELFERVGPKVGDRPGGYTRILRTGKRLGDNAEVCMIELVDYNEAMLQSAQGKTRRGRRKRNETGAVVDTPAASDASAEDATDVASESEDTKE